MGLLSWFWKTNVEDQLYKLEQQIRDFQTRKLKYSLKTKSVPTSIFRLLFVVCIIAVIALFFIVGEKYTRYGLMVATCILSYAMHRLLSAIVVYYYSRNSDQCETSLEQLILDQREVLEELKRTKEYIKTHEIVLKYERTLRVLEKKILNIDVDLIYHDEYQQQMAAAKKETQDNECQTPLELLPVRVVEKHVKVFAADPALSMKSDNTQSSSSPNGSAGSSSSSPSTTGGTISEQQHKEIVHKLRERYESLLIAAKTREKELEAAIAMLRQQGIAEPLSPSRLYSQPEIGKHTYAIPDDAQVVNTPVRPRVGFFDAIVNKLIGQNPENCIALICARCFSHNGLQMLEDAKHGYRFKCWQCKKLNIRLSDTERDRLHEHHSLVTAAATPAAVEQSSNIAASSAGKDNGKSPAKSTATSSTSTEDSDDGVAKVLEFAATSDEQQQGDALNSVAEIEAQDTNEALEQQ